MVKPLSAAGPTFTAMAKTAERTNVKVVKTATDTLHKIVAGNGARYRLRGRGGGRVPLTAMTNVRLAGSNPVGAVKGIPEGFWSIVEHGRGGGYLVARRGRGGQAAAIREFGEGTIGARKPIRTPHGPRQWARPGPHGPIGHPWRTSMREGRPVVMRKLEVGQGVALAKTFTS